MIQVKDTLDLVYLYTKLFDINTMTKVFVVDVIENCSFKDRYVDNQDNIDTSLEQEKVRHEEKELQRKQLLADIIINKPSSASFTKSLCYTLVIILIGFSFTIPFTIIPAHDIIKFPKYWYELFFHSTMSETLGNITFCLLAGYLLNIHHILKARQILIMCVVGNVVQFVFLVAVYLFWDELSGYQFPMPLMGLLDAYSSLTYRLITIFFLFPAQWRKSDKFRSRVKYFILAIIFPVAMDISYNITSSLLRRFKNRYQPIVALVLPIIRKIMLHVFSKITRKTADGDLQGANIMMKYRISIQHTLFLCYAMGSFTTHVTQWVLMGVSFFTIILLCQRIVRLQKRGGCSDLLISLLQDLVTFELAQFNCQLSFILVFAAAYYGPNSMLFGNVSNSYWSFTAIEDIHETLGNMVTFFLVDCTSGLVSAIILQIFCKINLLKILVTVEKEFGLVFGMFSGRFLLLVRFIFYSFYNCIYCKIYF